MSDLLNYIQNNYAPVVCSIFVVLFTAEIYRRIRIYIAHRDINIAGFWGEITDQRSNHRISAGRIFFDKNYKMFRYEGTCYHDDGTKFSHWRTIASFYDQTQDRLFYIFINYMEGRLSSSHYGYGVINTQTIKSKHVPVDGSFISPEVDSELKTHSMFKLNFDYRRSDDGSRLVDFISSLQIKNCP